MMFAKRKYRYYYMVLLGIEQLFLSLYIHRNRILEITYPCDVYNILSSFFTSSTVSHLTVHFISNLFRILMSECTYTETTREITPVIYCYTIIIESRCIFAYMYIIEKA